MKLLLFNVNNKYWIKNYKGIYKGKDTVSNLANFVKDNNIDILCSQEVIEIYRNRLIDNLEDFKVYGNPRIGNNFFTRNIEMIKRFNESVNIFTKLSVILDKTIKLPNFPDILPRVVTIVEVKLKDNNITVLNTHLSAYSKKVKKRQLKCLLKIIKSINTPLILTGDFNMDIKSDILNKFIFELNNLGIRHLEIKGKTFKNSKETLPIDHIFISNCLTFESLEKIKDEELSFSDHYPILMKLK